PPELDLRLPVPRVTPERELRTVERERTRRRDLEREGHRFLELGDLEGDGRWHAERPELVLVATPPLDDVGHLGQQPQRRRDAPQREAAVADDVVAGRGGPPRPRLLPPAARDPPRARGVPPPPP